MGILNNFFKKEAPLLGLQGLGGGLGFLAGGGSGSIVKASGGDVDGLEPGNGYAYHTFTTLGNGTFTVNSALTAEILVVAGGGDLATGSPDGGSGAAVAPSRHPGSLSSWRHRAASAQADADAAQRGIFKAVVSRAGASAGGSHPLGASGACRLRPTGRARR